MLETVKREAGKTVPHGNIFGEIYDVTTTDLRFFLGKTSSGDGVTMTKTRHSNASLRRAVAVTSGSASDDPGARAVHKLQRGRFLTIKAQRHRRGMQRKNRCFDYNFPRGRRGKNGQTFRASDAWEVRWNCVLPRSDVVILLQIFLRLRRT
jgi:hypothetical protein